MELQKTKLNKRFNISHLIPLCSIAITLSCAYPKNFTANFYSKNEQGLISIKTRYKKLYNEKPFSILFEEKTFNHIAFEFLTDTVKYIYRFNINETAFHDSLIAYHFNPNPILNLIKDLKEIGCTWITNLDYYENYSKRYLVLMAVRNKALDNTFKGESYCTLTFFEYPQPFDEKGIFLDRADSKKRRQINGHILHKVNDTVGYAITKHYR
jgi:hypothetical protein